MKRQAQSTHMLDTHDFDQLLHDVTLVSITLQALDADACRNTRRNHSSKPSTAREWRQVTFCRGKRYDEIGAAIRAAQEPAAHLQPAPCLCGGADIASRCSWDSPAGSGA